MNYDDNQPAKAMQPALELVLPVPRHMTPEQHRRVRLLYCLDPMPVHVVAAFVCGHKPAPVLETWSSHLGAIFVHHTVRPSCLI